MNKKTIICLASVIIIFIFTISAQASEPTWLFWVPKAESLKEDQFSIGFVYFDFGILNNMEIGIHGFKYSVPDSDLALGFSLFPLGSPYLVFSPDIGSGNLSLGIKASPYIFFAGLEFPLSKSVKFFGEISNGLDVGLRIIPAKNWTLDIMAISTSLEIYKYKYNEVRIKEFHSIPFIQIAYTGKYK
jgi:hypothetical protein